MFINKTDVPVHQKELFSNSPTPALLDRKSAGFSKDAICLHSTLGHNIADFPYSVTNRTQGFSLTAGVVIHAKTIV